MSLWVLGLPGWASLGPADQKALQTMGNDHQSPWGHAKGGLGLLEVSLLGLCKRGIVCLECHPSSPGGWRGWEGGLGS